MTDTTDIKALRELLTHEDRESDHHVGVTVTTLRLLLSKSDQLEAERQRAAGSEEELHKALHREKAAERKLLAAQEEIAALKTDIESYVGIGSELATEVEALKGKQVPVASELIPEGMKYSSALPEFVGDSNEISSYRCWIQANTRKVATQEQAYADAKAVCELFTAPQNPVIDLSNVLKVPYKISGQRFTAYDTDDLHAAIEAAGGIVKDGE